MKKLLLVVLVSFLSFATMTAVALSRNNWTDSASTVIEFKPKKGRYVPAFVGSGETEVIENGVVTTSKSVKFVIMYE
jgi:hypothetical protein